MTEEIQEDSFSSDTDFDEEADSESSSDVDAKIADEDVFDIEFFKCYSALKKKDEKIYNKEVRFFQEDDNSNSETEEDIESKRPKMTLLDHQLNLVEEELDEAKVDLNKEVSKSFYEKELDEIKKSIEKVSADVDSDDDDLLVVKNSASTSQSVKPKKKIEDMLDKLEKDEDISHLKQVWSEPEKLTEDEKFLRNYIVNKLYIPENVNEFFSKNLDDLSDVDEPEDETKKKEKMDLRSDEKDFDKIKRIPRKSTKTIRDLVEKQEKKEKRIKVLEKEKKKKKAIKEADCEDLVGDLPTKFHYRETEPNDYGLSAEELLMATDEELEKWVKLKDAIAYRTPEEELQIKRKYDHKRQDLELKRKIFKSIYDDQPDNESIEPEKDSKHKKEKNKSGECNQEASSSSTTERPPEPEVKQTNSNKRKKKHKRGLNHKKFAKTGVAPDRLLAYGLSKNKLKKSKLL